MRECNAEKQSKSETLASEQPTQDPFAGTGDLALNFLLGNEADKTLFVKTPVRRCGCVSRF